MITFSANLGFLWTDRPLADAIRAAHAAGFDAVECHWPYAENAADVTAALTDTGLSMLGLNAPRGNVEAGENGLAALVGREAEAHAGIDAALDYADALGAGNVHVLSGAASGDAAQTCFIENLRFAADAAAKRGRTILIRPTIDAPGYFLNHTDQARRIIEAVGAPNLKLMFDYYIQILEGDLTRRIDANLDIIGHIQFAGVPSRPAQARSITPISNILQRPVITPRLARNTDPRMVILMARWLDGSSEVTAGSVTAAGQRLRKPAPVSFENGFARLDAPRRCNGSAARMSAIRSRVASIRRYSRSNPAPSGRRTAPAAALRGQGDVIGDDNIICRQASAIQISAASGPSSTITGRSAGAGWAGSRRCRPSQRHPQDGWRQW